MTHIPCNPVPGAERQPEASDALFRDAERHWLETVIAHHVHTPAPDQAALTARVLANERAMFGRQITRLR
ncbi:hypothetical protein [Sphingomonas sp.]|uniref:hypothetical protein n=1 Tax=Sphingomonas sp. TaxID=28214 RepID=UPI003B003E47